MGQCFTVVKEDQVAIIETCGKYSRVAEPGCHCVGIPAICDVRGKPSLRLNQCSILVDTKSKDNVLVSLTVTIQYRIIKNMAAIAFYRLENPLKQIRSYVFDAVRSSVPTLGIDDVYQSKKDIAESVRTELEIEMKQFGFEIIDALITDINIMDNRIKDAMNDINSFQRLRIAFKEKSEAEKEFAIMKAEAECMAKELLGVGIANQRKAIIDGLRESIKSIEDTHKISSEEIFNTILMTQYFDTIKYLAKLKGAKLVLYQEDKENELLDTTKLRDQFISAAQV